MTSRQEFLTAAVDAYKEQIIAAERHVWGCPELGFQEWKTTEYFKKLFEDLGYTIQGPKDIPGFYVDFDTGRPGPKVLILGELDALPSNEHPEAVDGKVHSCGHHVQCTHVYGVAAALKQPGVADGLCGSVRMMLVPAEEGDDTGFRAQLRKEGTISFYCGKVEFMARGYMDGCDLAMMLHALSRDPADFSCDCQGSAGAKSKRVKFIGKSFHGSRPDLGVNAMSAALMAMNGINAIKDTLRDEDRVRIAPAIVNPGIGGIPGEVELSIGIRSASAAATADAEAKVDRILFTAAAAIGATVEIEDASGYAPFRPSPEFLALARECMEDLVGKEKVDFRDAFNTGATDLGNVCAVIPCIHPFVCGSVGPTHSKEFRVADPNRSCVNGAKAELLIVDALLGNGAEKAKGIIANYKPLVPTMAEYIARSERMFGKRVSSIQEEDGNYQVTLRRVVE